MPSEDSKATRNTLIGAGATILAALIGLIAAKAGSGDGSNGSSADGSPTPSTVVTAPASTPATTQPTGGDSVSPSSIAPAPPGSATLVWRHNVRFPSETGLDLRDNQPVIVPVVNIPDFETAPDNSGSPGFLLDGGKAAGTVSNPNPTLGDCMDSFISQSQTGIFEVQIGQSACFQSRDGTRVAVVTVSSWDRVTSTMNADVTVWQAPVS